jgi:hypothetical protein
LRGGGLTSPVPTPDPLPSEDGEPDPGPEVIAELVQVAAPILGSGSAAEGRVRNWARKWGLPSLRMALKVTAENLRRGIVRGEPAGYAVGVMKTIKAEGGVLDGPLSLAPSAAPEAEAEAWAFILGPRTPCPGAGP